MIPPTLAIQFFAGSMIGILQDTEPGDLFGESIACVGDIDGDGMPEFVVGSPLSEIETKREGRAWVISNCSRRALYEVTDHAPNSYFGIAVAGPGDLNGDGIPDFVVGTTEPFRIYAYSGRDGHLLHVLRSAGFELQHQAFWTDAPFAPAICGVGDVDGDGCADYALGCMHDASTPNLPGSVWIVSGRDGAILRRLPARRGSCHAGESLAALGDIDGDGAPEIALWSEDDGPVVSIASVASGEIVRYIRVEGVRTRSDLRVQRGADFYGDGKQDLLVAAFGANEPGRVLAYSCETGKLLRVWTGRGYYSYPSGLQTFGAVTLVLDDVDSDGVPDLFVSGPSGMNSWRGILSGADDRVVRILEFPGMIGDFAISASTLGDFDGDGMTDFVLGDTTWGARGDYPGFVRLYSGRTSRQLAAWGQSSLAGRR